MESPLISQPKTTSRKGAYVIAAIAVLGAIAGVVAAVNYNGATSQTLVSLNDLNSQTMEDLFAQWKLAHGKTYTGAEHDHKFSTFKDNYVFITNWNADPTSTSTVGLNEYADLNTAEFSALKSCLNMDRKKTVSTRPVHTNTTVEGLPAEWNWATQGAVTPIKNQGNCGSCWSFSTTGCLEGLNFLQGPQKGTLLSFSEQQLVSCSQSFGNQGCDGGLMDDAFEYVEKYGIEQESQYPYTSGEGVTGTCKYTASDAIKVNTGYTNVAIDSTAALQNAAAVQPISVAIEADQSVFQLYTGGVITSASCGTSLDHGVLVVGWGVDASQKNQQYFIVKNSWGATWGQEGFVWIGMNVANENKAGICGILSLPSYATE